MDNNTNNMKKKNKYFKYILVFYKKLSLFINHLEYLFKNKFITQEFYIEKMYVLNEIQSKINNFETFIEKKRLIKTVIENLLSEINDYFEKICIKIGSENCISTLETFIVTDDFLENKSNEYKDLLNMCNEYFIPISCNKINNIESFFKKYHIEKSELPIITTLFESSKNNTLIEKIYGATIVIIIDDKKIIYINGIFKKDSLNICRTLLNFKDKTVLIDESLEYLNIPSDFKEKYIEQMSLRDFIVLKPKEISDLVNNEYSDFITYKNKSLSVLIKEFIKSNIEKQRKIIILFLLADSESQFTAHIIFDLISDKSFVLDSSQLSDIIFNSLHWKIQQSFKLSKSNFETSKSKLENITINSVPYEERILYMKASDNIKSKAMEKLKEINGSKENSIKAQQWLDGLLKIPFEIFNKEPIINFFKNFQTKVDQYVDIFTLKIFEFNYNELDIKNKLIYNIIVQIIDEYHSNIYKSENAYSIFIKYLELIKINIETDFDKSEIFDDNILFDENTILSESVVNDCVVQLNHFKKIKSELYDNNIVNKNNLALMIKKLNDLESMLNLNLLKNESHDDSDTENSANTNINFKKFIVKNLQEFDIFIDEWNNFRDHKKKYMKDVDKILDKCTYGQTEAKNQMKRIIGQWMNGNSKGQCFGLCGPPGVGKTTLCKNGLAKCLFNENNESRPFAFIPLGGATNGSILEGHNYTYLGSTWGKIVDVLMETKCMNPIIYIDELDKISKTEHGREIISILTHITDQSQNKEFYDRYFTGIPIDLSQILFIFSYNNREDIDKILRDRIQEINIKPLSGNEKLIISQNYIIPEILNNIGFSINEIIFNDSILTKIIEQYTHEAGIRKLNEILYDIVREINLKKIMNDSTDYPITVDESLAGDILNNMVKLNMKKINNVSKVGLVNGLYATNSGLGGITIIQVMKTISDKKFGLEKLTGNQGDVMKESMNCALTLAWNILPSSIKDALNLNESKEGFGLHIHCPESATPKDGPSAGLAITLAIISRATGIAIRNDVAMTGEVDLLGNACEIGGLYSKLQGALNAGVNLVLIPRENEKDVNLIFKKEEEEIINMKKNKTIKKSDSYLLIKNNSNDSDDTNKIFFRNKMEIHFVDTIFDILDNALVENSLEFNRNF